MAIAISIVALAVSVSTFLAGLYRDRRDLLFGVLQSLLTPDQQRGRRLIYDMADANTRVEDLGDDRYDLINSAFSALNVLGMPDAPASAAARISRCSSSVAGGPSMTSSRARMWRRIS